MRYARAAFGLALLLALSPLAAAQQELEQEPIDLVFEVHDLTFQTIDLVFTVEDLAGAAAKIGGGPAKLTAAPEQLQVTETETEIRIELSGDVLFDFDKADIRPEAEPVLNRVAEVLVQHPDAAVTIAGHTDAKGSDSYNLKLSQRRAASVKDWLVANGGVDGDNMRTRGFGESRPVARNANPDGSDNPEGRQKNRRVEISVRK
jgi:outer membrane protein OmpA-like peptidoglycan-associated protein